MCLQKYYHYTSTDGMREIKKTNIVKYASRCAHGHGVYLTKIPPRASPSVHSLGARSVEWCLELFLPCSDLCCEGTKVKSCGNDTFLFADDVHRAIKLDMTEYRWMRTGKEDIRIETTLDQAFEEHRGEGSLTELIDSIYSAFASDDARVIESCIDRLFAKEEEIIDFDQLLMNAYASKDSDLDFTEMWASRPRKMRLGYESLPCFADQAEVYALLHEHFHACVVRSALKSGAYGPAFNSLSKSWEKASIWCGDVEKREVAHSALVAYKYLCAAVLASDDWHVVTEAKTQAHPAVCHVPKAHSFHHWLEGHYIKLKKLKFGNAPSSDEGDQLLTGFLRFNSSLKKPFRIKISSKSKLTSVEGMREESSSSSSESDDDASMLAEQLLEKQRGRVRREFPGQWLNSTLGQLRKASKLGSKSAQRALSLLVDSRSSKP